MILPAWRSPKTGRSAAEGGGGSVRLGDLTFAVIDADMTGTSVEGDRVTGIAVVPVAGGAFRIADLSYCAFPGAPDGLPPGAPADATDWRSRYLALRERIAGHVLVTYNPAFVGEMIRRTCAENRLPGLQGEWLDVASASRAVGSEGNELLSMAYWSDKMQAGGRHAHDATYDVFAMAQLLQAIIAHGELHGIDTLEALDRNQKARTWLRG